MSSFSFVSCYKVKSDMFILSGLATPFDATSWISILFMVTVMALILTLLRRSSRSDGIYVMICLVLENSIPWNIKLFEERFPPKSRVFGVRVLLGVWILTSGSCLTNWYKTSFTMDMIVPALYAPPWETWLDIEGMEALLPFNMFEFSELEPSPPYLFFGQRMYDKFHKSIRFKEIAKIMENMMLDPTYTQMLPIDNGSVEAFGTRLEKMVRIHLIAHSPVKPIEYSETARLVEELSTCGKIAFIDTTGNVASLLPFLNDNPDNIKYLSGIEPFLKYLVVGKFIQFVVTMSREGYGLWYHREFMVIGKIGFVSLSSHSYFISMQIGLFQNLMLYHN
ncbi:hypothetical protein Fcan01_22890 [Folsomia candida]|uniref:Uncharacterized protein n=1 Tax=Folsomia candida TaxID=158441 RepID=A0A226DBD4_FOLCA|nr:hypothetical protein Fcan01_22890 [Folsomia candida]